MTAQGSIDVGFEQMASSVTRGLTEVAPASPPALGDEDVQGLLRRVVHGVRSGEAAEAYSALSEANSSASVSLEQVRRADALFDAAITPVAEYLRHVAPRSRVSALLHAAIWRSIEARSRATGGSSLTAREAEVLALVAEAKTNKQIGAALHISPGTVKRHLANICEKLHAVSRLDAVRKAGLRS
ncbi:LuxR C-terminal-related transcriptional regulator [Curtobacterium sp. MCSS17_016]|uniref:helix-turn-helix transcriptional regulator n=1 Tax=Curtobacterium sp. MCSS17_016 TaxID=2175644 RepID=UPI0024DFC159|nr:LuxR C-terminal-related transcriptional regulator [Curtobacterium sp. MCSS17_016]